MSYIIMGRDECNTEFRPDYPDFYTEDAAYAKLGEARERYPEARSLWVELLRDKAYYQELRMSRSCDEYVYEWEDYDDYE